MEQTLALEHFANKGEEGQAINIANMKKRIRINHLLAKIWNAWVFKFQWIGEISSQHTILSSEYKLIFKRI